MTRILIGAGHQNIQYNSITSLRGSTGAPNEMEFNVDVCNKVSSELRKRGFEVKQTDANANDDKEVTGQNWDLALFVHYDSDSYGSGGGFVAFPKPETDYATKESQRIAGELESEYFKTTGIVNKPERRNANTDYYYMWRYLSKDTPCVLIECGVGMHVPDDWQTLHHNRPLVVEGIVRGICRAFGVSYDTTGQEETEPETPPVSDNSDLENIEKSIEELRQDMANIKQSLGQCQTEIETAKGQIADITQTIGTFEEVTVLRKKS